MIDTSAISSLIHLSRRNKKFTRGDINSYKEKTFEIINLQTLGEWIKIFGLARDPSQ